MANLIGVSCEDIDKDVISVFCKIQKRWLMGLARDAKAGRIPRSWGVQREEEGKELKKEQVGGRDVQEQLPHVLSNGMWEGCAGRKKGGVTKLM